MPGDTQSWQRPRANFSLSSDSFFSLPFSLPFFFLYAPGVNKQEDPVARKTTLYMKPFMPSRFPIFVHEEFLSENSILQSTLNISLRVPVIFVAADVSSYWKDRSKEQELYQPSLWANANYESVTLSKIKHNIFWCGWQMESAALWGKKELK